MTLARTLTGRVAVSGPTPQQGEGRNGALAVSSVTISLTVGRAVERRWLSRKVVERDEV